QLAALAHLAPRRRTLLDRLPRWVPAAGAVAGAVAIGTAIAWLWHPEHGAIRRDRLLRPVRERIDALLGGGQDLVAIPIEDDGAADVLPFSDARTQSPA
ncbi:MAG: hypothetical protein U0237_00035, partial [Thermoleophilia bacterium]